MFMHFTRIGFYFACAIGFLAFIRPASGNNEVGAMHSFAYNQQTSGAPNGQAAMFDAVRIIPFLESQTVCASDTGTALATFSIVVPLHPPEDAFDDDEVCGGPDIDECCFGDPLCEQCMADLHPPEACCFDTDCIDSLEEINLSLNYSIPSFTLTDAGEETQIELIHIFRDPLVGTAKFESRVFPGAQEVFASCDFLYSLHGVERPKHGQCRHVTYSAQLGPLEPGSYNLHTEDTIGNSFDSLIVVEDC